VLCCQVVVLERTREAGKKVLMSGGTRCNVLPLEVDLPVSHGRG
jgi:predicted flavoprotein YhiN